ncbi:MAG: 4Fe-4S binding protein, partial [Firmicutes bacterium]|nr:4Fe-4S binding protein [Bacillota bacterium]
MSNSGLKIDADNCIQCGICQKVCPAQAVKGK